MTDAVDLPAGSAGEQTTSGRPSGSSNWWAIFSMMLGVAALISAEALPGAGTIRSRDQPQLA